MTPAEARKSAEFQASLLRPDYFRKHRTTRAAWIEARVAGNLEGARRQEIRNRELAAAAEAQQARQGGMTPQERAQDRLDALERRDTTPAGEIFAAYQALAAAQQMAA